MENADKIDLSLRANGDTFIDHEGKAKLILNRIDNNSSTVIGIAGVRGAGKSSLALNVLKKSKENNYFTI